MKERHVAKSTRLRKAGTRRREEAQYILDGQIGGLVVSRFMGQNLNDPKVITEMEEYAVLRLREYAESDGVNVRGVAVAVEQKAGPGLIRLVAVPALVLR